MVREKVSVSSGCSILPAELRFVMAETFAGSGEVFVDHCEILFQRLFKILAITRTSAFI